MPKREVSQVRPSGWANPKDEWRRMCPMDYGTYSWENWILTFPIAVEADKPAFLAAMKAGIEATLGQCRHAAGTIERNDLGDFSIVTRADASVPFVTLWLDGPEDVEVLSYAEWEKAHFCCEALTSNPSRLVVYPRSCNASPAEPQPTMAFQITFIQGGAVLGLSSHHWFMDAIGYTAFIRQLAGNCAAVHSGTPAPSFDESLMDRTKFLRSPVAEKDKYNASAPPSISRKRYPCGYLMFHLPASKARELKAEATPADGSMISTYDAVVGFLWRIMMRNRAKIYKPRLGAKAIFGEPVNMRERVEPKVNSDYQGIYACGAISLFQKKPLRLGEVISSVPLSQVASFIRSITNGVNAELMEKQVDKNWRARDKLGLHKTLDWLPPMSFVLTDWRSADFCNLDFGVGKPTALRSPSDEVLGNLMILYPRRKVESDPDHGWEIVLPFEEEFADLLIQDPELGKYMEFCGYEAHAAVEDPEAEARKPKLGRRARLKSRAARVAFWVFLNFPK